MATPTAIVAYLALFAGVAAAFLFVNLLVGRLVRPKLPNQEKLEVYECGEPVIGSSFVQFDLRFYVVALLFIIFDVEVAFFFPWATVFGKSVQLTSPEMTVVVAGQEGGDVIQLSPQAKTRLRELGVVNPQLPVLSSEQLNVTGGTEAVRDTARKIALMSFADIAVFFAVLLVGFAYVWRRGDLNWVRAVSSQRGEVVERSPPKIVIESPRSAGSILST
ncbi:MAG: NADH-quinone oxidoreductase subunit A [Planctomycetes bacterium]|nr:NADH-quinone oxidoreductase subunit A [Planctomycetota bacterium]